MAPQIAPSDLFPAVLRFLIESGLSKSAAKFQKETGIDADAAASLPKLEEVYNSWMGDKGTNKAALNGNEISVETEVLSKKEKKKKKKAQLATEVEAAEGPAMEEAPAETVPRKKRLKSTDEAAEEPAAEEAPAVPRKKRNKSMDATEEAAPVEEDKPKKKRKKSMDAIEEAPAEKVVAEEAVPEKKKKKDKTGKDDAEKPKGEVFRRVDDSAWRAKIEKKDPRLLDNTHKAKVKFGVSVDTGDSWADKASEDLLKVKGKDFRKEMMKKKKASWKGGGALDQGVNSIPFSDSDDE